MCLRQYSTEQEEEQYGQERTSRNGHNPGDEDPADHAQVDRLDAARHADAQHRADKRVRGRAYGW